MLNKFGESYMQIVTAINDSEYMVIYSQIE